MECWDGIGLQQPSTSSELQENEQSISEDDHWNEGRLVGAIFNRPPGKGAGGVKPPGVVKER